MGVGGKNAALIVRHIAIRGSFHVRRLTPPAPPDRATPLDCGCLLDVITPD